MTDRLLILIFGCIFSLASCISAGLKIQSKLIERKNGRGGSNGKPGTGRICTGNTKLVTEHDISIKHLATAVIDGKKERETIRTENREAHDKLFDQIKEIRNPGD